MIPHINTPQMMEVDRLMIEEFHIELIQMMENAGRNLARLARKRFLEDRPQGKKVIILVGSGNNGGGSLVMARHIHNWGAEVDVYLSRPQDHYKGVSLHQLDILQNIGLAIKSGEKLRDNPEGNAHDLIVDGLIGYSLSGNPHGLTGELIAWANRQSKPILSLDVPSGIDLSTGRVYHPVIRASATMTLALPKVGLFVSGVRQLVGELYLADISVPQELYARMGLQVGPIFHRREILRLED